MGTLINLSNILIWLLGVFGYRIFLPVGSVVGVTGHDRYGTRIYNNKWR